MANNDKSYVKNRQTSPNSSTNGVASVINGDTLDDGDQPVALRKELGLINGVAIIVGIIVGSGIFISPRGVLQESGSVAVSLIIWCACGLLTTIGALCYAELGTSIPKSGGDYAYIYEAFGDMPSFLYLWVALLIINPCGNAISAVTFANYILEAIAPLNCDIDPSPSVIRLISGAVIVFLIFVNCYNVKWATFIQDWLTFAKIVALSIIIVCGAWQLYNGQYGELTYPNSFKGATTSPGHIALAFYSGLFSYSGWNYLNFVTEEMKDPFRNLPRAIYISLPLVTIIYLLANIAYFTVLTTDELLNSNAVAVTFGDRILPSQLSWIMPLSVALSTFGGLNGCIFASSRLFFVGARNGHLPKSLAMINLRYFTPMPSLVFLGILSLLYLCTTEVFVLINYTTFIESLSIAASVGALLWLRHTTPEMIRPIKTNIMMPITFFLTCLFLVCLPFYVSPYETGIGVLITLTGVPVYLLTLKWRGKPVQYKKLIKSFTFLVQKLFYCAEED